MLFLSRSVCGRVWRTPSLLFTPALSRCPSFPSSLPPSLSVSVSFSLPCPLSLSPLAFLLLSLSLSLSLPPLLISFARPLALSLASVFLSRSFLSLAYAFSLFCLLEVSSNWAWLRKGLGRPQHHELATWRPLSRTGLPCLCLLYSIINDYDRISCAGISGKYIHLS